MKKEYVLLFASVIATVLISVGLLRWLAPHLLGLRPDQLLVKVSKEVPPFYANIFRAEDFRSTDYLINDPLTAVRAHPLLMDTFGAGPNDILGFRNRSVPNVADIITIGDSQTYGNNASLEDNWPSRMSQLLDKKKPVLYSMATGGWGAVQYLYMFQFVPLFQPRVAIIAFYTGNDPIESFNLAYANEQWAFLRPDKTLRSSDAPAIVYPPPESDLWKVHFRDGSETIFTPKLRLACNNMDVPAVRAGYGIMHEVARQMAERGLKAGVKLVITIIPTKELVYAIKVAREGIAPPAEYKQLIEAETRNIEAFAETVKKLQGATFVDVLAALQRAALSPELLYPPDANGHPVSLGYNVIAESIARAVNPLLPEKPRGLVAIKNSPSGPALFLVNKEGAWSIPSDEILGGNGWKGRSASSVQARDLATLPFHGTLTQIDPRRFGPGFVD